MKMQLIYRANKLISYEMHFTKSDRRDFRILFY